MSVPKNKILKTLELLYQDISMSEEISDFLNSCCKYFEIVEKTNKNLFREIKKYPTNIAKYLEILQESCFVRKWDPENELKRIFKVKKSNYTPLITGKELVNLMLNDERFIKSFKLFYRKEKLSEKPFCFKDPDYGIKETLENYKKWFKILNEFIIKELKKESLPIPKQELKKLIEYAKKLNVSERFIINKFIKEIAENEFLTKEEIETIWPDLKNSNLNIWLRTVKSRLKEANKKLKNAGIKIRCKLNETEKTEGRIYSIYLKYTRD